MKKIGLLFIICSLLLGITGCTEETTSTDENNKKENIIEKEEEKYMTGLEWTNFGYDDSDDNVEWLKVAVEIDGYDGDILKIGTYTIRQTYEDRNIADQRIYNLFVTKQDIDDPNNVPIETNVSSIGGINGYNDEITLEKGDFLYIQKISFGNKGHIKLILK